MKSNSPNFRLLQIYTSELSFIRNSVIDENYSKVKNDIKLNVAKNFHENKLSVSLTVEITQSFEDKNYVNIKSTTVGVFQKDGEMTQDILNSFSEINAPAIIFPYIRENISNISAKGGLEPILIQPVNFVELNKKNKSQ